MNSFHKKLALTFLLYFLFFQACENVYEEEAMLPDKSQPRLLEDTQAWFDEEDKNKSSRNARRQNKRKPKIKPQWDKAKQSRIADNQNMMSVPILKEDALHHHVQLITLHQEGEVKLGFILEIAPTKEYRKEYGLAFKEGFRGSVRIFSKEGELANTFAFGEDGQVKQTQTRGKPDADVPGMMTLRNLGGEDDENCGCIMLEQVVIRADPISNGGSGGVVLTVPEGAISAPTGDLGVSSGGDDYGTASYIGQDANGDYEYRLPLTPPEVLDRVGPEIDYLASNIPDERIQTFIDDVEEMLTNHNNSEINTVEALELAVLLEDIYVFADIMIMDNPRNYSDDEISTSVGDEMEEEIPYLSRGVQRKVFGIEYDDITEVPINLSGSYQSGPADLGSNNIVSDLKEMLRYAFLIDKNVVSGSFFTNDLFNFTQANNNFSYTGSPIPYWQAELGNVKVTVFTENIKFTEIELYFPGNDSGSRNTFRKGVRTVLRGGIPVPYPYQIRMIGQTPDGSFKSIAAFEFTVSDRQVFDEWYRKYRTGQ